MSETIDVSELSRIELNYYKHLYTFYDDYAKSENNSMDEIVNIINSKSPKISARFLEWFVTKYCKVYYINIDVDNMYNKEENYNVYIGYNAHIDTHDKYYFDPFKRRKKCQKFIFNVGQYNFETNVCQLIYFKWIIQYDILKYVKANYTELSKKIKEVGEICKNIKENKKKKKKQSEKSKASDKTMTTYSESFSIEI